MCVQFAENLNLIFMSTVGSERLGAHILELPYKGHEVSMFIILPPYAKPNAIESVINQLSVESLQEIMQDDLPRAVEVSIPKFTVEKSLELTPVSSSDLLITRASVGVLGSNNMGDYYCNKVTYDLKIQTHLQIMYV
jgi:serine protease inhibitor